MINIWYKLHYQVEYPGEGDGSHSRGNQWIPGNTRWCEDHERNNDLGGEGGVPNPPFFLLAKSYFFCYLERHAKIQNHRQTPFGRRVSGRKKERKKKNKIPSLMATTSASARTTFVCTHSVRTNKGGGGYVKIWWLMTIAGVWVIQTSKLYDLIYGWSLMVNNI